MATIKSGMNGALLALTLSVPASAIANIPSEPKGHTTSVPNKNQLFSTYSSPQAALAALEASGRHDILDGSAAYLKALSVNPSDDIDSLAWYALFGSGCCLVVLASAEEDMSLTKYGNSSVREILLQGDPSPPVRWDHMNG